MNEGELKEPKRRHRRVPLAAYVTVDFAEDGEVLSLRGMAADISLSGVGLYIERSLQDGTRVSLEINFRVAGDVIETEKIDGLVVYSISIKDIYFVGIEFSEELASSKQPALYYRIQNILNYI